MKPRTLTIPAAILTTLVCLTGCHTNDNDGGNDPTSAAPTHTSKPTHTTSPRAEAKKSAINAVENYVHVADKIGHNGGKDTSALNAVAAGDAVATQKAFAKSYRSTGMIYKGETRLADIRVSNLSMKKHRATVHACFDASHIKLYNSNGSRKKRGSDTPVRSKVRYQVKQSSDHTWRIYKDEGGTKKC